MSDRKPLDAAGWRDFLTDVSNAAYGATGLVERAEHAGHVVGNGHHIRQQLAELACAAVEAHRPDGRDPGLSMALDHLLREWERVRSRAKEGR